MRRGTAIGIVCACAATLGLAGYAAADIADVVPGFLTASQKAVAADPPSFPAESAQSLASGTKPAGDAVSASDVQALWSSVAKAASDGKWTTWGSVVDAQTGEVLLDASASTVHTPASTTKVLTAFTALSVLDASTTLKTSISASGSDLYLGSDGDLLLGAGASNPDAVDGRAGLADLAAKAAESLKAAGTTSATLHWAKNPFDGEARLQAWTDQSVANYEGAVSAMAIDAGRVSEDAYAFVDDPARNVAQVVANALTNAGVATTLAGESDPIDGAETIASVKSATMGEQIRWMLHHSDNTVADQYCRLAAKAKGVQSSFGGSVSVIRSTLEEAGVATTDMSLGDCSGLSSNDRIAPATLTGALRAAIASKGDVADLVRSLPWAGLDGTMTNRMTDGSALANAQAKTGSLASVSSLVGVVQTTSGRLLVYAIGNDAVPDDAAALTRPYLDDFVTGLADL
ncbi:D-alanyl-D-alanine carboxypeptidase/D-alanyl-D-alanine endopeptidase [Actinomyces culturomici]|uniref:D-alanyl-D-alanine carboxypeptidase/D-alanyl-D-alanine endopeptidase n=1 Tax=Actinomyces culturomici TaxID=1926276 RepID=UPI000E208733|nr:D-alanyl-D-alanine carboxypeptidase/D-alanyl-D-alanine-endopeptidase [Actinomyces culturomici]